MLSERAQAILDSIEADVRARRAAWSGGGEDAPAPLAAPPAPAPAGQQTAEQQTAETTRLLALVDEIATHAKDLRRRAEDLEAALDAIAATLPEPPRSAASPVAGDVRAGR